MGRFEFSSHVIEEGNSSLEDLLLVGLGDYSYCRSDDEMVKKIKNG